MLSSLRKRLQEKARLKLPEHEIEDIVQDVLLVVAEKLHDKEVETLQAYAEGILRHKIYDHYQKRSRRKLSPLDSTVEVVSTEASPEEQTLWKRHIRLIQGVAEENRLDRAILQEHFVDGAPLREVASSLGVSAGAVNGRLYRFRQKVMQHIGTCFAFVLSLGIGFWSRISRAWTVVRTGTQAAWAGSLGSLSVVFSWFAFFGGAAPIPPEAPKVQKAPLTWQVPAQPVRSMKKATAQAPLLSDDDDNDVWTAPVDSQPRTATRTVFDWDSTAPRKAVVDANGEPSVRTAALNEDGASRSTNTAQKSPYKRIVLNPVRHFARKTVFSRGSKTSVVKTGFRSSNTGTISTTGLSNNTSNNATGSQSRTSTGSTGSGSSRPGNSGTTRGGSVAGLDTPGRNPVQAPQIDPGMVTPGPTIPSGVDRPSQGMTSQTSFAMRQDGAVYQLSQGLLKDISGERNSSFGCGNSKDCRNIIGSGPTLVFQKDGQMLIVGEGFFRISNDSGQTWEKPDQPPSPSQVLQKTSFVLNQKNIIWSRSSAGWMQLRKAMTSIQEVRVKLTNRVEFEDDGGFKTQLSWTSKARLDEMKKKTDFMGTSATKKSSTLGQTMQTQGMQNPNNPNSSSTKQKNPFLPSDTTTPISNF